MLPQPFSRLTTRVSTTLVLVLISVVADVRVYAKTWLDINVTSWHSRSDYQWEQQVHEFNHDNFGLGATHELRDWLEVKAGWFENSYEKTSLYGLVALKWELFKNGALSVAPGLALGAVSGYQNTPERTGELAPWGAGMLSVTYRERWRANVGYLPSSIFRKGAVNVALLQVSFKL